MSDKIARAKAEEEARLQALLKKRSKVLQRELPRPPLTSLDLIKASLIRVDEDKSSFVPPTLIEQADEMVRRELVSLLEHDNAKYPLDEIVEKEKKKGAKRSASGKSGSVPVIENFEEYELNEADHLIQEESQLLRFAMGHEDESLDDFIEAHITCLNDIMYFSTRSPYGLSSVAGNMEKIAALQNEFEFVKKRFDDDSKKADCLEKKLVLLTKGYQIRGAKIESQIQATFKQMDTAGTEVECFKALQKQEQLAASHRINSLWEEVQKQKELEQTLQKKYGDLIFEKERIESLVDACREKEENAARDCALELAKAKAKEAIPVQNDSSQMEADSVENDTVSLPVQNSLQTEFVLEEREDHMVTDDLVNVKLSFVSVDDDNKITDNLADVTVGEDLASVEVPKETIEAEARENALEDGDLLKDRVPEKA